MSHIRCACLCALIWLSPIALLADDDAIDFAAFYPLTQESGGDARRDVSAALLERFPKGTPLADVVAFFDRTAASSDDDVGDPINIRFCQERGHNQDITCIWFADIPDTHEADALANGIFGVTWEISVRSNGDGGVAGFGVDYLIERL